MDNERSIRRRLLPGLFGLVGIVLAFAGRAYYHQAVLSIETVRARELEAIGRLKVGQISEWRRERMGDALISTSGSLRSDILRWMAAPGNKARRSALIAEWMMLGTGYGYHSLILVAPDGHILLRADPGVAPEEPEPELLRLVSEVSASRKAIFGDLFRCVRTRDIHLDAASPILDDSGKAAAVLLMRMDPNDLFYPLIQNWPTPTESGETLLVRRDGNRITYLNTRRHSSSPAVSAQNPLSGPDAVSLQAIRGKMGIFQGADYRGVDVLAAIMPVPDSRWILVSKIDTDEIFGEARSRGGLIALLISFSIVMTGLLGILLWMRQESGLYKRLYQSEASISRARAIMAASNDAIFVAEPATARILDANDGVCHKTGYSREELLSLRIPDIVPELTDDKWRELVVSAREQGNLLVETACRKKDGQPLPVEAGVRLVSLEGDAAVLITGRDISRRLQAEGEHRRLQEQFYQAQKTESIGRIAGGVAHDFNNLLTVINGYSELALKRISADDPVRRAIEQIHKAGDRAARLVGQLLAFSRKQVLRPQVLDLNRLVDDIRSLLTGMVREDIEIVFRFAPGLPSVLADPPQLEQVIMNLVANAQDAMPGGGTLTVETGAQPGRQVRLTVRDTGTGIESAVRQHLFEPFFTTRPRGKGTGLGLATVQGIVLQSGGQVEVETEPGKGSAFHVLLPAVDTCDREEAPSEAAPAEGGGETILLVEDQPDVRHFLATILEERGYSVLRAEGGEEALALSAGRRIDLLVTDIVMPRMSGLELAGRLRARQPSICELFISGYSNEIHNRAEQVPGEQVSGEHVPGEHRAPEGAAFLQKPFSEAALARKIREVLDRRPGTVRPDDAPR